MGEWRPVRGWSLKVRGTGLIGLMGLRRESGGVGLGSGAALPRVGVHFRFQAAHARCNRRPPGFLPLGNRHRRQGSRMRPLVKFLPRVKPTTTTPVSTAGGSGLHHHHHSPITTTAPFSGPPSRFDRFAVSPTTLVPTPGLEITGRVARGRNPRRRPVLPDVALTLKLVASYERSTFRARRVDEPLENRPPCPTHGFYDRYLLSMAK